MIKNKQKVLIGILVVIALTALLYLVIRSESAKITTFEDCQKAGWLVRNMTAYSYEKGYDGPEEKCTLWTGKSFLKYSIFFPTQNKPATEYMQALLSGELELIDDCLRVNGDLIIWPYGFSLSVDEASILDDTGHGAVRVGDRVRFGGGGLSEDEMGDRIDIADILSKLSTQFPSNRCSGPYWLVGEILK